MLRSKRLLACSLQAAKLNWRTEAVSKQTPFSADRLISQLSSRLSSGANTVEAAEKPPQYVKSGRLDARHFPHRLPVFAVVEVGPTQYKVSADDLIYAEKLKDVDVNDTVKLTRVLLLGSRYETIVGRPLVPGASVTAAVEVQIYAVSLS